MRSLAAGLSTLILACLAQAQFPETANVPRVVAAPVDSVRVQFGKPGSVQIDFRVAPGFHINSNKPNSELLIPTAVLFNPPTEVSITKLAYPAGEDKSFAFSPDEKLNVYTGDFAVSAMVSVSRNVTPGKYRVHGELRSQACDDRACYPPTRVPVQFDVVVPKATAKKAVRRNPGQSPHIHK